MDKSLLLGNKNPASQVLILLGIALVSVAVFSFIPLLLAEPLFGINGFSSPQLFTHTDNPQAVGLLKLMQLFQSLGLFVVPPLLFSLLYSGGIKNYLNLNFNFKIISAFAILVLMFAALPAINWMGELNENLNLPNAFQSIESWMKKMEEEAAKLTGTFLKMDSTNSLLVNLMLIAVIPAIGEELLFRGALQKILSSLFKNKHVGIWVSAILFSALHMQFYGFFPRMLLGAMFGYVLIWSGSLWIPILGHFVNNASAILISFFEQRGQVDKKVETIGAASDDFILVGFSLASIALLLFWFWKHRVIDVVAENQEAQAV
jgi:membrane protease YdiL (CAAX protease family)